MRLAINEIKICLLTVFEKYKFQRVPETKDLEQIAVLLMKPKDNIILKIVKR
jgi:predicted secreted protein